MKVKCPMCNIKGIMIVDGIHTAGIKCITCNGIGCKLTKDVPIKYTSNLDFYNGSDLYSGESIYRKPTEHRDG